MNSVMFNNKLNFNFPIFSGFHAQGVGLGKHLYSWAYRTIGKTGRFGSVLAIYKSCPSCKRIQVAEAPSLSQLGIFSSKHIPSPSLWSQKLAVPSTGIPGHSSFHCPWLRNRILQPQGKQLPHAPKLTLGHAPRGHKGPPSLAQTIWKIWLDAKMMSVMGELGSLSDDFLLLGSPLSFSDLKPQETAPFNSPSIQIIPSTTITASLRRKKTASYIECHVIFL